MNIKEQKIINGIKYLVKHTNNVGRTKLFKLLFFWDFIHFKRFGMAVTGYDYYTYPFGPVPKELYDQITKENLPVEFKNEFIIIEDCEDDDDNKFKKFKVVSRNTKIDLDWLSPNEKNVLEEVALIFKYASAKEMTEITHLHNSPWDKTIKEKGEFQKIDYFLAVDDETTLDMDTIKERYYIQKDLLKDGRL
ncbi:MAG: Panacea domain-containing protein [Candidatus Zhuqueibacterota bacterium]